MSLFENKKIGEIVTLSASEQTICRAIAKKRFSNNRKSGVENKKVGNQSNEFTDLNGFGAEFAFCKLFNVMPDFSIQPRKSDEFDYDCKLHDGVKIDVKTTKYKTGRLLVAKWKSSGSDAFALMIGEFPTYQFKGFCSRERAMSEKYLKDMGHGEAYFVEQEDLLEYGDMFATELF
jgi:hypothetical protein